MQLIILKIILVIKNKKMKITTILPIHEFSDEIKIFLDKALNSLNDQKKNDEKIKLIVVFASKIKSEIENYFNEFPNKFDYELIENNKTIDFQSQINLGVESVDTEYFTILEFDDELSNTYYNLSKKYIENYPDVDLFLPLIIETNVNDDALKLTNEVVWSRSFVGENGELGFLNTKSLNNFTDFKICGGIFKKSEFENIGELKTNIVLTFQYEFLLRLLNNGAKVFTIPKIIYKHVVNREDSLFSNYHKTLTLNDRKFWFETAKKESNFFQDREIDTSLLKK